MRFLIDAQLPPTLADRLIEAGHVAERVNRIGLGAAADADVWRSALGRAAVLITKDADFLDLSSRGGPKPPIVWVRFGNTTKAALWRALQPALPEIVHTIETGESVVEVK